LDHRKVVQIARDELQGGAEEAEEGREVGDDAKDAAIDNVEMPVKRMRNQQQIVEAADERKLVGARPVTLEPQPQATQASVRFSRRERIGNPAC
jgi:hypothetical protein